jgi:hypothetical protein
MSQVTAGQQEKLIVRLADWIARQGLVTPAVFLLETNKPFSFLGGQALWMFQPLLGPILGHDRIAAFAQLLEDPASVDRLLGYLESRRSVDDDPARADDAVL